MVYIGPPHVRSTLVEFLNSKIVLVEFSLCITQLIWISHSTYNFFKDPKIVLSGDPLYLYYFLKLLFYWHEFVRLFYCLISFIHWYHIFFAVPYYEENRLDAARRDNKELNIFFEAPYSTKGNSGNQDSELANSSKWCTLWTNPHIRT